MIVISPIYGQLNLCCGIAPTRSPSAAGIFPHLKTKVLHGSLMGFFTQGRQCKRQPAGSLSINLHGSRNPPRMKFPPLRVILLLGFSSIESRELTCPSDGISPLGDGNASAILRAPSRIAYGQSKPSAMRFFPLEVPLPLMVFPSLSPTKVHHSVDGISPTQRRM